MKNPLSEYMVDEIPEGKENEYFSKEQAVKIIRKLRTLALLATLFSLVMIILGIGAVVFLFIEVTQWVRTAFYIVVFVAFTISCVSFYAKAFSAQKYFKKLDESSIQKDTNDIV